MTFTIFDIIVLIIITISSFLGGHKGLISITVGFIGFIISIIATIMLFPHTQDFLLGYIEHELAVAIIAGIGTYIFCLIITTYLTTKISMMFNDNRGIADRILGFLAGCFRGIVLATILFVIIAILSTGSYVKAKNLEDLLMLSAKKYPEWLKDSTTTPYLELMTKQFIMIMPSGSLKSVTLPSSKDEDIMDIINRKKDDNIPDEVPLEGEDLMDEDIDDALFEE
ncbi:MAG: CvpA family protein [Rickettsiaceae bacterium]|nr:CvpA family protein [Rickettsiaceae bacterium]